MADEPSGLTGRSLVGPALLFLLLLAVPRGTLTAQEPDGQDRPAVARDQGTISLDSAAVLRRSLNRPPNRHPFDAWDAVALPFRVATYPLDLLGDGLALLMDLTAEAPPLPVVAYRDLAAWGLVPTVGSIGARSGPAVGMELRRYEPFFLETAYSIRDYQLHRAGVRWRGGAGRVELSGGFHRQAEAPFFGIGAGSSEDDETTFLWDRVFGQATGELRTLAPVTVRAEIGYEENRIDRSFDRSDPALEDVFTPGTLFGTEAKTRFFRIGLGAELDLTRRRDLQLGGAALEVGGALYRGAGPTEADFHRLRAVFRGHVPLNDRQRLAVRAGTQVNRSDSEPGVPFFHLASLGDRPGGRGYQDGRFRGHDLLALTAEWRYEVWRELHSRMRLEGFVFAEDGAVARRIDEIGSSDWRASFGGGLRLVTRSAEVAHLYLATGDEGSRVQLDVGTSF